MDLTSDLRKEAGPSRPRKHEPHVIQSHCLICGRGCCNCIACHRRKGFLDSCGVHDRIEELKARGVLAR
jgi:hypothetical protein